jgi:membrane protein
MKDRKEKSVLSNTVRFVKTDVWRMRLTHLPPVKSFLVKQLRIVLLAMRGLDEDRCGLRASALTFYTLFGIVPVAAMAFGIAKGFGFERLLQDLILEKFSGREEVATYVIESANRFLESARGGVVAGMGVAVLFWTIVRMLGTIERSFNDIWGIRMSRSLARRFTGYLSIALVCPVLLIASSSIKVFVAAQAQAMSEGGSALGPLAFTALKLLPYVFTWIGFVLVYMFMPNTRVELRSAVLAGVVAGTVFQIVHWAYINLQIVAVRYSATYGSFAALPLFLLWLQISWLIVLFGAEISFAHQNVHTYEFEPDCLRASGALKRLLALWITHMLVRNFCEGERPWTADRISHELEAPVRLVHQVLYDLVESGILSETAVEGRGSVGYQPARSVETITVKSVLDSLERKGTDGIPLAESEVREKLSGSLKAFDDLVEKSPANVALKNLVSSDGSEDSADENA